MPERVRIDPLAHVAEHQEFARGAADARVQGRGLPHRVRQDNRNHAWYMGVENVNRPVARPVGDGDDLKLFGWVVE